ncbi:MAG: Asp-tRNA(Asn)/Glu-tRNA(Gln) amidotransferase subunit GatC [Alphaproteobacteria bacterium]
MSIDLKTVNKIASLSRLGLGEGEKQALQQDLSSILGWVEQLNSVNVDGVDPTLGAVTSDEAKPTLREDQTQETPGADAILANAPARKLDFFTITKVIE